MFKNRSEMTLRGGLNEALEAAVGIRVDPSAAGRPSLETSLTITLSGLGEAIGQLAATIERARELPDMVSDACELRQRLELRQAKLERKQRKIEGEISLAELAGEEFTVRRLHAELRGIEDERADAAAMLAEVDRVLDRLRRERRALLYRLSYGEALAEAFPPGPRRERVYEMLEDARRRLALPPLTPTDS
jgi:chromosome segregation ATPase